MGFFTSKSKRSTIVPVPTDMTEAWFDALIETTPAEAGLQPDLENIAYVRNFMMIMVLDDGIINSMVIDGDRAARDQYEQLIQTTDSLEARVAFLNGWNASYVSLMRDRISRQRERFLLTEARENGGYPLQSKEEIRSILAAHRRSKPYG